MQIELDSAAEKIDEKKGAYADLLWFDQFFDMVMKGNRIL